MAASRSSRSLFHRAGVAGAHALLALPGTVSSQGTADYLVRRAPHRTSGLAPGPRTDADPLACLDPGTCVTEIESIPYWRKVRLVDAREKSPSSSSSSPHPWSRHPLRSRRTPALKSPSWTWEGDAISFHAFDDGIDGNAIVEGRNIALDGGPDSIPHRSSSSPACASVPSTVPSPIRSGQRSSRRIERVSRRTFRHAERIGATGRTLKSARLSRASFAVWASFWGAT
jgi:hypothetical protein